MSVARTFDEQSIKRKGAINLCANVRKSIKCFTLVQCVNHLLVKSMNHSFTASNNNFHFNDTGVIQHLPLDTHSFPYGLQRGRKTRSICSISPLPVTTFISHRVSGFMIYSTCSFYIYIYFAVLWLNKKNIEKKISCK